MALHDDLLQQAWHLLEYDSGQASLRRAVSAAYYALFHLLITESIDHLDARHSPALKRRMRRAYAHADMDRACKQLTSGGLPDALRETMTLPIEDDLIRIAKYFSDLQEARFMADYDIGSDIAASFAETACLRAQAAFELWAKVRKTPNATVFLASLLLGNRWNR